jgi:phytanoyl-CoA hydroxylase
MSHYPVTAEYSEEFYLSVNPDIAEAVRRGDWPQGYTHFCVTGKSKGRLSLPEIDEAWYASAYPLVAVEIEQGKASSPADHYKRIGQYRGYLPNRSARRPDDPADTRSKFGGLWTDHRNALDVIEGKRHLGFISEEQATLLRKWIVDGYAVLESAVDADILDHAQEDLEKAYAGKLPGLRYAVHAISQNTDWVPEALINPAKALDVHWFSLAIRELIFSDRLVRFLGLIFERRPLASQTLGFWRGSSQAGHQDSAYVNYSLPLQFAASWIALEDVKVGAGELFYHVGSHAMPEYLYNKAFKGAEEAKRAAPGCDLSQDYPRHISLIAKQAEGMGLKKECFLAKRGDILIWSADLAHGGSRISGDQTRKSVVTHYCPSDVVPLYFETKSGRKILPHRNVAFYTSGHYDVPAPNEQKI